MRRLKYLSNSECFIFQTIKSETKEEDDKKKDEELSDAEDRMVGSSLHQWFLISWNKCNLSDTAKFLERYVSRQILFWLFKLKEIVTKIGLSSYFFFWSRHPKVLCDWNLQFFPNFLWWLQQG